MHVSKGEAKKFGWKFLVTKRAHNVVFWKDANLVLSFLLMWTGFNDKWYGKPSLWSPCALCIMCWSESIAYRCSLIRTFRSCQINLVVCACFLKAKSTFPLLAIIKIWFSFFNYKTGYPPSNYQIRLFGLPWWCYKQFLHFFHRFFFVLSFSLIWGGKHG